MLYTRWLLTRAAKCSKNGISTNPETICIGSPLAGLFRFWACPKLPTRCAYRLLRPLPFIPCAVDDGTFSALSGGLFSASTEEICRDCADG